MSSLTIEDTPDGDGAARPAWSLLHRVLFRFGLIYFLLYAHPFPLQLLPTPTEVAAIFEISADWVGETAVIDRTLADYGTWFVRQERWAVDATATHVFGIERVLDRPYGSGDPLYSYIRLMLHLLAAGSLTALWSALQRSPVSHRRLLAWTLIGLRLYVAFAMLSYGLSKVLPSQFPPWLRLDRLLAPYGDSSPMNVLWSTMSSSEAYTIFGGMGEVVGGALLLFRRTATLGALVTAGVMVNVVAMNFCFDVPVKLYSSHLTLGALAIALPDLQRLGAVLLLNRSTTPRDLRSPHLPVTGTLLKVVVVAAFVVPGIRSRLERIDAYDDLPEHYGIWDVGTFSVDEEDQAPLTTDPGVWKHLVIDRGGRCSIHRTDGTRMPQQLEVLEDGALRLTTSSSWEAEVVDDRLSLTGQFAWRFLGDLGDESSTLPQENREPQLRWTLVRVETELPTDGPEEPARATHGATNPAPTGSEGETTETGDREETGDPEETGTGTATDETPAVAAPDAASDSERADGTEPAPWVGTWSVVGSALLGDRYTPRLQPAPARFSQLELRADGTARITLPTGRIDTFRWERTEDRRPTLRLSAQGQFQVERSDGALTLTGRFRGHEVRATCTERDLDEFMVQRRGFHWVNPIPWNRY